MTLLEVLITVSMVLILATVAMPAVKVTTKRAQEVELRQKLRQLRTVLDQFHEDWAREGEIAKGQFCTQNKTSCLEHTGPNGYPKRLETLLGIPLSNDGTAPKGPAGAMGTNPTEGGVFLQDSLNQTPLKDRDEKPKIKRYLRRIPFDPMTGIQDWGLRCYKDPPETDRWCAEDVFDVFTKSQGVGLDKSHYRDW